MVYRIFTMQRYTLLRATGLQLTPFFSVHWHSGTYKNRLMHIYTRRFQQITDCTVIMKNGAKSFRAKQMNPVDSPGAFGIGRAQALPTHLVPAGKCDGIVILMAIREGESQFVTLKPPQKVNLMRSIHFIVADAPMRSAVGLERIHRRRFKSQHGRVISFRPRSCQCLRIDRSLLRAGGKGQHPRQDKNPLFHRNFLFINPLLLTILHVDGAIRSRSRSSSSRPGLVNAKGSGTKPSLQHATGNVFLAFRGRSRAAARRGEHLRPVSCPETCWERRAPLHDRGRAGSGGHRCMGAVSLHECCFILARGGERFPCVSWPPTCCSTARGTVEAGFVP